MRTSADSQYSVDIHFRGICSHFHSNVLPGIPHRVVLPDAMTVRPGLLTGPEPLVTKSNNPLDWLTYVLMPHFAYAVLLDPVTQTPQLPLLTVDGVLLDGLLYTNARLSIANATQTNVTYPSMVTPPQPGPNSFFDVPQLTSFVSHYTYSTDVVLAGRASAYFDLDGGEVTAFMDGDSLRVRARVLTDGPPQLQITPLAVLDQPVDVQTIPLTDPAQLNATLIVGNSGLCSFGAEYDFLLHYLTGTAGLPRALTQPLPGMPDGGEIDVKKILQMLESILKSGWPPSINILRPLQNFDLQASCSDSRYP